MYNGSGDKRRMAHEKYRRQKSTGKFKKSLSNMNLPVNKPTQRLQRVRAKTTILWPDSSVVVGVNEAVNDENSNQKKEPVEHWIRRFAYTIRVINKQVYYAHKLILAARGVPYSRRCLKEKR